MSRTLIAFMCAAAIAAMAGSGANIRAQPQPKEPEKLVFPAKKGDVMFLHAKHSERVQKKCDVCHDSLFKQSAKEPLNYRKGMHRPAEESGASCAACHAANGAAFPSKGNCETCHGKGK